MFSRLLDPANTQQFDDFKKCYGEILYRWGLREKRAEVLKFVSCPPDPHKGIGECQLQLPMALPRELRNVRSAGRMRSVRRSAQRLALPANGFGFFAALGGEEAGRCWFKGFIEL